MRRVDWSLVTADKGLALLTIPDLEDGAEVYLADFRDSQALAYNGQFLGMSPEGWVKLGGHPIRMIDGVWYVTELESKEEDIRVTPENLQLIPIK